MDKNTTRKVRIETALQAAQDAGMDEDIYEALFEDAHRLAYRRFNEPTDDHVLGVFERLVWNLRRGLGETGATTLH